MNTWTLSLGDLYGVRGYGETLSSGKLKNKVFIKTMDHLNPMSL